MATQAGEIEVKLTLKQGDFNKLLGQSQKDLQGFGQKSAEWLKSSALAITAALAGIAAFGKKSVDAYIEQELAVAKLVKALENQGIASDATVGHLQEMASTLQMLTGVGDDVINNAQATLVTFGLQGDALDRTTQAALDMSAAMGIDLTQAAQLLGKAFVGETGTLGRYGIQVDKNKTSTEKFDQALRQVEGRFGGTAAAAAATFGGQLKILGQAFGEMQEVIGQMIAGEGGGIVAWLTQGITKLTEALTVIANARAQFTSLGEFLKTFAVSILGTIVLTITTLIQKMYEMLGQIPVIGGAYRAMAEKVKDTNHWIEEQIVAIQASKIQSAQATGAMVANEKTKQAEYKNTASQIMAITDQTSLYVKDKMAEEIKARSEAAEQLKKSQQELAQSLITTQADLWNRARQFSEMFFQGVGDGFADMIVEGRSMGDAMKQVFRDMAKQIISMIVQMIAKLIAFLILREAARTLGMGYGQAASAAMTASAMASKWGGDRLAEGGMIGEPSIITGLRTGKTALAGEAGPEAVVPMSKMGGVGGSGGGITINISGQFIDGNEASWQRLMREKIVPEIRRFTMAAPTGPFNRRRGVA